MRNFLFAFLLTGLLGTSLTPVKIQSFSADVVSRKIRSGNALKYEGKFLRKADGELVYYFLPPNDFYVIIDKLGTIKMYFPAKNEAIIIPSEEGFGGGSLIELILQNQIGDMGVRNYGYELVKSDVREGKEITFWEKSEAEDPEGQAKKVKLVHENGKILYMAYLEQDGTVWRETYFNSPEKVDAIDFPTIISEITHTSKNDSLIEQTFYKNIRINEKIDSTLLNFKIPENVILK